MARCIAIDVGSPIVRAVAFDAEGSVRAEAMQRLPTLRPFKDAAEQELDTTVSAAMSCIREVVSRTQVPDVLAITGSGQGLWLLDRTGQAVRPAILASDRRAESYVREWFTSGIAAMAFRRSGNVPFAGSQAALIRALADHERPSLERSFIALHAKDVVLHRLTGSFATDVSDASLPFLNVANRQYDEELIDLYRVRPWRSLLPAVDPLPPPTRTLAQNAASVTGLPAGLPVINGPSGFPAAAIGAGVVGDGDSFLALGATMQAAVRIFRTDFSGPPAGMTICLPQHDRWLRIMPSTVGLAGLKWLLTLISASPERIESLLAESAPGANGLLTLPYFSPLGERAPFVERQARGQILGLHTGASQADLVRSSCEGIALAARYALEAAGLRRPGIVAVAAMAGFEPLPSLLANVLACPVRLVDRQTASARGAAMTALAAIGAPVDPHDWTTPRSIVKPEGETNALYERLYRRYRQEVEIAQTQWARATATDDA